MTPSNRRVRTRTHGGVGGAEPRGSPLSRLWLGHERLDTTHQYVEADLQLKERALAKLDPRPDRRDRLLLISALAIAVLSLLGAAGERIGYDRWLKANTVKRRTHSLFRQGLMLYHHLPIGPRIGFVR